MELSQDGWTLRLVRARNVWPRRQRKTARSLA